MLKDLSLASEERSELETLYRERYSEHPAHHQHNPFTDCEGALQRAIELRGRAAELFRLACQQERHPVEMMQVLELTLVDVLRRSRQWADRQALTVRLLTQSTDERSEAILKFQRQLIELRDDKARTTADARGRGI